jgi:hypothetical protein
MLVWLVIPITASIATAPGSTGSLTQCTVATLAGADPAEAVVEATAAASSSAIISAIIQLSLLLKFFVDARCDPVVDLDILQYIIQNTAVLSKLLSG